MSRRAAIESQRAERLRPPWLLADVGGTNCRFALRHEDGRIEHAERLRTADFAGPREAFEHALASLAPTASGTRPTIGAIGLAVAAPLSGDRIEMVNADWRFSIAALGRALGRPVIAMNDFVAQSYALARLDESGVVPVGPKLPAAPGARLAIGPGTGLGVGFLVPRGDAWDAVPSEGGHATAAAFTEEESAIIALARERYAHVSWERLVSGPGLELLHAIVAARRSASPRHRSAAEITDHPNDPLCAEAIGHFIDLLATAASNAALTAGAFGGVYLVGGVLGHLGPAFDHQRFRRRFEAKGRYSELLARIPTVHVVDPLAAFRGVAYALERTAAGAAPGGVVQAE